MSDFGQNLYSNLMKLCSERDLFFFKDHELDEMTYRVFSYHMGSYSDWVQPEALECRGVLFRINDGNSDVVELVSLPFPKFFNIFEIPDNINTLAEAMVRNGRLSEDVYRAAKEEHKKKSIKT